MFLFPYFMAMFYLSNVYRGWVVNVLQEDVNVIGIAWPFVVVVLFTLFRESIQSKLCFSQQILFLFF